MRLRSYNNYFNRISVEAGMVESTSQLLGISPVGVGKGHFIAALRQVEETAFLIMAVGIGRHGAINGSHGDNRIVDQDNITVVILNLPFAISPCSGPRAYVCLLYTSPSPRDCS